MCIAVGVCWLIVVPWLCGFALWLGGFAQCSFACVVDFVVVWFSGYRALVLFVLVTGWGGCFGVLLIHVFRVVSFWWFACFVWCWFLSVSDCGLVLPWRWVCL